MMLFTEKKRPLKIKTLFKRLNYVMKKASFTQDRDKLIAKVENKNSKKSIVDSNKIAQIVSEWTGVPVTRMKKSETKRLAHLESILHERVIGQDKAISAVSRAIRRSRSGIKDEKSSNRFLLVLRSYWCW